MTKILCMLLLLPLWLSGKDPDSLHWKWYYPDHFLVQFAGNIGFISVGAGYRYAGDRLDLDMLYGYVPESVGGPLHSITLKNTWAPFKSIPAGEKVKIDIITAGIPVSYTFGKQFFLVAPRDQYPRNYYNYSSALRIGIFAGGRIGYIFNKGSCIQQADFYYEAGTYDLLLHNYFFNVGTMKFGNIFNIALGIRLKLD